MTTKKKGGAKVSALERLHEAVAEYMIDRLESSQRVDEDDEDDFAIPLASGEVANIINFLKHNNITASPDDDKLAKLNSAFKDNDEFKKLRDERAAAIVNKAGDDDTQGIFS
jgi:hypothetical protein